VIVILATVAASFGIVAARPAGAQTGAAQIATLPVPPQGETGRSVMREAKGAATRGDDSAAAARWRARLARDATDQGAALGLAMLDLYRGRLVAADSGFARALRLGAGRTDSSLTRYAILGAAQRVNDVGRWQQAVRDFDGAARVARAAGDSTGEVLALVGLVPIESRLRSPAMVTDLARLAGIRRGADAAAQAAATCALASGIPVSDAGAADSALLDGARQAIAAGDARIAVSCRFTAAVRRAIRGAADSAIFAFGAVIAAADSDHDRVLLGTALQWRGYVRLTLGNYGESEHDLDRALAIGRATRALAVVGWSELNLAALDGLVGDWASAERHGAQAEAVLSSTADSNGLGIVRRGQGRSATMNGDTAAGRRLYLAAIHAADQSGRLSERVAAHVGMADLESREGHWDAAGVQLAAAHAVVDSVANSPWAALLPWHDGRVALARGEPRMALGDFTRARRGLTASQRAFAYAIDGDAALARLRLGDTTQAIATLRNAVDELDHWRATLDAHELRVLAFQLGDGGDPSAAPAEIVAAAARRGELATAFALAERGRARDLADQLQRARALRGDSTDGAVDAPRVASGDGAGRHRVADTSARADVTRLAAFERQIPDDSTAVLEYMPGPHEAPTTLLMIGRRFRHAFVLGAATGFVDAIEQYDALVDAGGSAAAPARALATGLLAPALAALPAGVHRLVIIPDGPLHGVTFAALRTVNGRPLIMDYDVSIAPSAAILASLWRRAPDGRAPKILAIGDPSLGDGVESGVDGTARALRDAGPLPRLTWAADEARLVGSFAPGSVVRLREHATAAYLQDAPLARFSIIHLATHAVIDPEYPLRSALVLARSGGRSGRLAPGDIAVLALDADLVVLSACRSARGTIVGGEGVRGLTGPFLAAGSRAVLATQWRIDDRDAVPLVYAVYRHLAEGEPITSAVRRASLEAMQRGAPEREWAAFVVTGDPLVRIPIVAPPATAVPVWLRTASAR